MPQTIRKERSGLDLDETQRLGCEEGDARAGEKKRNERRNVEMVMREGKEGREGE